MIKDRRGSFLVQAGAGAFPCVTALLASLFLLPARVARPASRPAVAAAATELQEAERQRQAGLAAQAQATARAQAARRTQDQLTDARIVAASRLRTAEAATEAAAIRMADLADRRREAERRLDQQAQNLGPLLPLIERLSLYPLETLLAIPADPRETLLGVTVLQGIARDMERQAERLARERAEVSRLAAAMQAQAPLLAAAQQDQATQAAVLDAQIGATRQILTQAEQDGLQAARDAATAAARADSLRDALAEIERAEARAQATARAQAAAAARGRRPAAAAAANNRAAALAAPAGPGLGAPSAQLGAPVLGTVIRAFGEQTGAGPSSGISYQPPPAARVVSPCGGRVVFAGPFRSYGLLMIVDCGGGYDFVLAGLARLDAGVGRSIRQAEPVGVMPGWDPRAASARPALYVELRKAGAAIDPAPFLRAHL